MTTMEGTKSYVVVSDELHHDKFSVTTFNRELSEGWDIRQLHMFTDGAGSQFKNRFVLSQVVRPYLLHESLIGLGWAGASLQKDQLTELAALLRELYGGEFYRSVFTSTRLLVFILKECTRCLSKYYYPVCEVSRC